MYNSDQCKNISSETQKKFIVKNYKIINKETGIKILQLVKEDTIIEDKFNDFLLIDLNLLENNIIKEIYNIIFSIVKKLNN